jgi:hypothetical protein
MSQHIFENAHTQQPKKTKQDSVSKLTKKYFTLLRLMLMKFVASASSAVSTSSSSSSSAAAAAAASIIKN